jgi:hypothetical protein
MRFQRWRERVKPVRQGEKELEGSPHFDALDPERHHHQPVMDCALHLTSHVR